MMDKDISASRKSSKCYVIRWYHHDFFKYAIGVLLVLTIILAFIHTASFWKPLVDFISTLSTPIIISFLFYYLLRPIVHVLEKLKIPRFVSIFLIYAITTLLLVFFFAYVGPILIEQITALADTSVETWEKAKTTSQSILSRIFKINIDQEVQQRLFSFAQQITTLLSRNLIDFLGFITRVATILAVIPFIVFYLLKDDRDFASNFMRGVPEDFGREVRKILNNIDDTLSSYINGLVIVSCSVGGMLFIGYMIINLNYALILSFIALILTTIPYLGPFLAITPAILVGLADSPTMVFKVILTFIVVQQLESNLISPQIIGQRLHIHPLTLILLLLTAGSLYGLLGLILATPIYAVSKVLLENLYKIYQLRYSHWKKNS